MVEVVWSDAATEELDRITAYIEQFNPAAAVQVGDNLLSLAQSLVDFPHRGRPAGQGRRELVTVPPYVLRYRVNGDVVSIISVRHGARRPE